MTLRTVALVSLAALAAGCGTQGLPRVTYLARHGQTEYNRIARWQGDPDLDQVGYLHRVSLWHLLRDAPIGAVYTSERLRTRRTGALVAAQRGLTVQPRAELNEIDSGIATGVCWEVIAPHKAGPDERQCMVRSRGPLPEQAIKVIQEAYREGAKDPIHGKMPLGESLDDLRVKTGRFVDELRRGYNAREVLVVGHGVINRALLHHFMGWKLGNLARIKQGNDQVYRLESKGAGKPKLFLYTPGHGWKACKAEPKPGQRYLDCNPRIQVEPEKPAPPKPAAPEPTQPAAPEPAQPLAPEPGPPAATDPAEPATPKPAPAKPTTDVPPLGPEAKPTGK